MEKTAVTAKAPPIKSQGIKTKLVAFISENIEWDGKGRWIEPFAGTCAVALNLMPRRALLADANPHLVRVYQDIQSEAVTPQSVNAFLCEQGRLLSSVGEAHYYAVRERFNNKPNSLDFLFLNRACFNGLIRFNSKGKFNVPFCRKPDRFRQAYVTKITNQVAWARACIQAADFQFRVQDWKETLGSVGRKDFVYIDPPYEGRHTDYFSSWSEEDAKALASTVVTLQSRFAISTWLGNRHRENDNVARWYRGFPIRTLAHFYHLGSREELRNEMIEALILSKHHPVTMKKKKRTSSGNELALV